MEISFGGTLGARSRSEAVLEGARSALERPKMTEGGPQAAQEPTLDHSGSILERFQGVQSAPRIGRAESRSTFAKIDFSASVTDFCLIWSPQTPLRVAFGLPLGALWGPLAALGVPWGSSRAPLGLLGGPVRVLLRALG